VARTADPLGGSYFVEALTDEVERARATTSRGSRRWAAPPAPSSTCRRRSTAGRRKVVGVNEQVDDEKAARIGQPDYSALEGGQQERLAALKARRSDDDVRAALARIRSAAGTDENLMPPIIDAVRAEVTLGEISDALREVWGTYDG
jgi:methylmalonyl-CoA mutase, N-terminal domain